MSLLPARNKPASRQVDEISVESAGWLDKGCVERRLNRRFRCTRGGQCESECLNRVTVTRLQGICIPVSHRRRKNRLDFH
jgi:hypothetical protein